MTKVSFPFDKIRPNSKIVIYGVGDVGRQYISQIASPLGKKRGVRLVFAVDGNGILPVIHLHDTPVFEPRKLRSTAPEEYDYIVIAVYNKNSAENIRATCRGFGVPDEKIIYSIQTEEDVPYVPLKTMYSPEVHTNFMPSFSWFGEDLIVKGIFRMIGISHPSYLDIGCNVPYIGNNTALLYWTGSKGINIDANINCIKLMEKERPDDLNLCIGVAIEEEEKDFYMVSEYEGLNSFSRNYIDEYVNERHCQDSKEVKSIKVQCERLDTIIQKYCGGVFPDYFDLDIEGLDDAVIASYDFSKIGPKVICVESHSDEVRKQLLRQGYSLYFDTPHNDIYVQTLYMNRLVSTGEASSRENCTGGDVAADINSMQIELQHVKTELSCTVYRIEEQTQHLECCKNELYRIYNSRTWKLMKPVWRMKAKLKDLITR